MDTCKYCGMAHGVRCPSVAAIEFHLDGTVRRVEFVQPASWPTAYPQPMPSQSPTVLPTGFPLRTGIGAIPNDIASTTCGQIAVCDPRLILMNGRA